MRNSRKPARRPHAVDNGEARGPPIGDDGQGEDTSNHLYYTSAWQVIEERTGTTPKVQYVWSAQYIDALVERDRDANNSNSVGLEERLYAQHDANFNTTALISTSGSVQHLRDHRAQFRDGAFDAFDRLQRAFVFDSDVSVV